MRHRLREVNWNDSVDPSDLRAFAEQLENAMKPIAGRLKRHELDWDDIHKIADEVMANIEDNPLDYEEPIVNLLSFFAHHGQLLSTAADNEDGYLSVNARDIVKFLWKKFRGSSLRHNLISTLRSSIDEVSNKLELFDDMPPEHPKGMEDPIYGKYIFSPQREKQVPFEQNTPREQLAWTNLSRHVKMNEPISQDVALDLMGVLDAKAYDKILHPPNQEFVYRGMKMTKGEFAKFIGVDESEITPEGSKVMNRVMNVSRGEGSSSWSVDLSVARGEFAMTTDGKYSVVLVARVRENPDSFITGPGGFYNLDPLKTFQNEAEAIGFGPIKVYKIYWKFADGTSSNLITYDKFEEKNVTKEGLLLLRLLIKESILSLSLR